LAANLPDGRWLRATPYFQVADRVLDLGMAPMVGLEHQGLTDPVGDERVVPAMKDFVVQLRTRPDAYRRRTGTGAGDGTPSRTGRPV
jgi:hypothetical protein